MYQLGGMLGPGKRGAATLDECSTSTLQCVGPKVHCNYNHSLLYLTSTESTYISSRVKCCSSFLLLTLQLLLSIYLVHGVGIRLESFPLRKKVQIKVRVERCDTWQGWARPLGRVSRPEGGC